MIFVSPGNTFEEIIPNLKIMKKAINLMFLRNAYTEPNNSQKFEIVISLPDDVRDN